MHGRTYRVALCVLGVTYSYNSSFSFSKTVSCCWKVLVVFNFDNMRSFSLLGHDVPSRLCYCLSTSAQTNKTNKKKAVTRRQGGCSSCKPTPLPNVEVARSHVTLLASTFGGGYTFIYYYYMLSTNTPLIDPFSTLTMLKERLFTELAVRMRRQQI